MKRKILKQLSRFGIMSLCLMTGFCAVDDPNPLLPEPPHDLSGYLFGGSADDEGRAFLPATDGGFWVIGNTRSYGAGERDVWVIKTDSEINEMWARTYGDSVDDSVQSALLTDNGTLVLAGHSGTYSRRDGRIFLKKIDLSGNEVWTRHFSDGGWDIGGFAIATDDGGFAIAGSNSFDTDRSRFWLIKTDGDGNLQWESSYGGSGSCSPNSIQQTLDGGFILYGEGTWDGNTDYSVWQGIMVRVDRMGNELWHRDYGGENSEEGYGCALADDGGFVAVGFTNSGGFTGGYIVKTDSDGNQSWFRQLNNFNPMRVTRTGDGGFILSGLSSSQMLLMKLNREGQQLWAHGFGRIGLSVFSYGLYQDGNGNLYTSGYAEGDSLNGRDMFVLKTDSAGNELR